MKIAVDAMGGDFAPQSIVEGAVLAAKERSIPVILAGDRDRIEYELSKYEAKNLPISVHHASEVVGMHESPSATLRKKKDTSVKVCFNLVKSGEASAVVSAGNSGAAMAIGMVTLRAVHGPLKPALTEKESLFRNSIDTGSRQYETVVFAALFFIHNLHIYRPPKPIAGWIDCRTG